MLNALRYYAAIITGLFFGLVVFAAFLFCSNMMYHMMVFWSGMIAAISFLIVLSVTDAPTQDEDDEDDE